MKLKRDGQSWEKIDKGKLKGKYRGKMIVLIVFLKGVDIES